MMLCKEDSVTLTDYISLITQHLDEPLTLRLLSKGSCC